MTDAPKRPRGRPRTSALAPPGASATERKRAQRAAQQTGQIELPRPALADADTLAQAHGTTRAGATARALAEAVQRLTR